MGRNAPEPESADHGPEVFAVDTDVVLGDACAVLLTGEQSELLRAVDAGTAYAFMSDQAFREVGWMSAKSARGHGVDHNELRGLITVEYLPRIAVVTTAEPEAGHWMPHADEVKDPDDVAHVQVARLIAARAVYSHDRDLRKPGHAPRTRSDYDDRVANLAAVTQRRELEHGTGMALGLVGEGAAWAVGAAAGRLGTRIGVVWAGVALAAAAATYLLLAPEQRRKTIAETVRPGLIRLAAELERTDIAARALSTTRCITLVDTHRLEVRVASSWHAIQAQRFRTWLAASASRPQTGGTYPSSCEATRRSRRSTVNGKSGGSVTRSTRNPFSRHGAPSRRGATRNDGWHRGF